MYIRKIYRVSIGIVAFIFLSAGIFITVCADGNTLEIDSIYEEDSILDLTNTVHLPVIISNTDLVAERIVNYEGYFVEDGSEDYVIGIAALYLHNSGNTMVASCSVTIQVEDDLYCFEATCIPPGATVLVQEKERKQYLEGNINSIDGYAVKGNDSDIRKEIYIDNFMAGLRLRNISEADYNSVCVSHKNYDVKQNIYIGGITYVTYIANLKKHEQIDIWPVHFDRNSRIVWICGNKKDAQ